MKFYLFNILIVFIILIVKFLYRINFSVVKYKICTEKKNADASRTSSVSLMMPRKRSFFSCGGQESQQPVSNQHFINSTVTVSYLPYHVSLSYNRIIG